MFSTLILKRKFVYPTWVLSPVSPQVLIKESVATYFPNNLIIHYSHHPQVIEENIGNRKLQKDNME